MLFLMPVRFIFVEFVEKIKIIENSSKKMYNKHQRLLATLPKNKQTCSVINNGKNKVKRSVGVGKGNR